MSTSTARAAHTTPHTDREREAAWQAFLAAYPTLRNHGDAALAWARLSFEAGWRRAR